MLTATPPPARSDGEGASAEAQAAPRGEGSPARTRRAKPLPSPAADTHAPLRQLRAEIEDLAATMNWIRNGEATLLANVPYIENTRVDIEALIAIIAVADYGDDNSENLRHILNVWEQMKANPLIAMPKAEDTYPPAEQLRHYALLGELTRRMAVFIGSITIPDELNAQLDATRVGHYIPFHLVFQDELPDVKDRDRLLAVMRTQPKKLPAGQIDIDSGLVYRCASRARDRFLSWLEPIGALALATGLVVFLPRLPVDGWPLNEANQAALLIGWVALLLGLIAHVGIETAKNARSNRGLPPILAIGDLSFTVSARGGQFALKIGLALIGLFGFVFSSSVANLTPVTAFLVGYSLDSFVGIFGSSLDQAVAAQSGALKKPLGAGEG